MQAHDDAFSSLVLDSLRLQETIAAAQNAPAHERAWFLQGTRQTLYIAGLHWMIRHDEACELLDPLPLAFLPHMPSWFCGLAHWHGQALPVLDLAPFWQLQRQEGQVAKRMLLVLGHGNTAAGVLLDRLPGHPRVWLAGGAAGRAFTLAPAIGARVAAHVADPGRAVEPRWALARLTGGTTI